MLYPNTDFETWSKIYGITPLAKECPCCAKEFLTNIPFAIKGYRGLQTPVHECGDEGFVSLMVPYDKNIKEDWNELIFG